MLNTNTFIDVYLPPPEIETDLEFHYRETHQTALAEILIRPLLARYGLTAAGADPFAMCGRQAEVEWTLRMPCRTLTAWSGTGRPGQSSFNDQFRPTSRAIQEALRAWLPFAFLDSGARFMPREPAKATLLFAALPAHRGNIAGDFTYDPTNPAGLRRGLRNAIPGLTDLLGRLYPHIAEAIGDSASVFLPSRTDAFVRDIHRRPRMFGSLIAGDLKLTEAFISLGSTIEKSTERIDIKLRRLLGRMLSPHGEFAALAPLILMEATAAMATARGSAARIEASLYIRDATVGEFTPVENNFFRG